MESVRLEASSMCQLKCPLCGTANGTSLTSPVGWGYLKFSDFRRFVDTHPEVRNVELANQGEIFLNPELSEIIEYAHLKGIALSASTGANLNHAKDEILERLVRFEVRHLTCSIDGASSETYRIYRQGGEFDRVIRNIQKINAYKEQYDSDLPRLSWQFVIMGHNEHELPRARRMARDLGMEFVPKLNWDPSYAPVRDREFVRSESGIGAADRVEFQQKFKREYLLVCHQLWVNPQVNWDGKLLGCCKNMWSDFGNVFELGLRECITSERYRYAKRMLLGEKGPREDIPCSQCPVYKCVPPSLRIRSLIDHLGQLRRGLRAVLRSGR